MWVCDEITESVSDEDGYCKVISACADVLPSIYGQIIASLVCKGEYSIGHVHA